MIALNPPPSNGRASSLHKLDIRNAHTLPVATAAEDGDSNKDDGEKTPARPHHKLTCADCTRAFCLDSNLSICKNAREEDVFTTCFQRDSLKDETVVVIFIFATAGLLAWAVVKPWVDRLRERTLFMPLRQHDPQSRDAGGRVNSGRQKAKGSRRTGLASQADPGGSSVTRGLAREDDAGGEAFAVGTYDEDMHADQDAVDIVSGIPSGSGSGSGSAFRP